MGTQGLWRRRTGAIPHLTDEIVDRTAFLALNGEPSPERTTATHLAMCALCRARVADRQDALGSVRSAIQADIDAGHSDAALVDQREAILARIATRTQGPVLPFPSQGARIRRRDRPAMRWIAAAAAAGLVTGLTMGQWLDGWQRADGPDRVPSRITRFGSAGAGLRPAIEPAHAGDEIFLAELETTLVNRRVLELRALDTLTPRPSDAGLGPR